MNISELPKITERRKRRLGQGQGSGRGKTAGRGTKGQNARGRMPLSFEGGALPLIKRLPFRRGKGKNKSFKRKPAIVSLSALNSLPSKSVVDEKLLIDKQLLRQAEAQDGVKILANGMLTHALTIKVAVSKKAKEAIEKAGGTVSLNS